MLIFLKKDKIRVVTGDVSPHSWLAPNASPFLTTRNTKYINLSLSYTLLQKVLALLSFTVGRG